MSRMRLLQHAQCLCGVRRAERQQVLAGDLRRAQQALAAAERAATAREAQLAAAAGEAASLGRAHHEAQVEIQQLLQDLQVSYRISICCRQKSTWLRWRGAVYVATGITEAVHANWPMCWGAACIQDAAAALLCCKR